MTHTEFAAGFRSVDQNATYDEINGAFVAGDIDQSGTLSFGEFSNLLAMASNDGERGGERGGRGGRGRRGDDIRGGEGRATETGCDGPGCGTTPRGGDHRRGGSPIDEYMAGLHGVIEMEIQQRVMELMSEQNGGMVCKEWMPADMEGGQEWDAPRGEDWETTHGDHSGSSGHGGDFKDMPGMGGKSPEQWMKEMGGDDW
jgi:hypothetical protein